MEGRMTLPLSHPTIPIMRAGIRDGKEGLPRTERRSCGNVGDLAGTGTKVLSVGPVDTPAGVSVEIIAKRTGVAGLDGIGLKVKVS